MARKIAVVLRKGGSGKTTTAVNLAAALHKKKQKTLLIDLDPQANATISLGIDPIELTRHVNNLFTDINIQPEETITKTSFGMFILPSHPDLADTEAGMRATQVGLLKGILEPIEQLFDFIIIDTPPSESYLTVNALAAVDEVIIPLQTHYLAMRGLREVLEEIEQVRKGLNPSLKIAGILPTMVNKRTNMAKTVLETVLETYKELVYPFQVNFSIRHTEASLVGLPIILYRPEHQGSQAYFQLTDHILRKEPKGKTSRGKKL